MKYLLDTHAFLWFLQNEIRLPNNTRTTIETNEYIYLSAVSLWEIAIKINIHKLNLKDRSIDDLLSACKDKSIDILNITSEHIKAIADLPWIHRDRFDRMLVAQAKVEDMTLITCDQYIPQYPIKTVW